MAVPTHFDSPDHHEQQPDCFDDRIRCLLADFKDQIWHDSRNLAIQTLAETNKGDERERAVHALEVGFEHALLTIPEDQRDEFRTRGWNRLHDKHPNVPLNTRRQDDDRPAPRRRATDDDRRDNPRRRRRGNLIERGRRRASERFGNNNDD